MNLKKYHQIWTKIDNGLEGIEQIHIKQIGEKNGIPNA